MDPGYSRLVIRETCSKFGFLEILEPHSTSQYHTPTSNQRYAKNICHFAAGLLTLYTKVRQSTPEQVARPQQVGVGFLILPLELRQQILYESFSDVYEKDVQFSLFLKRLENLLIYEPQNPFRAPNMLGLASNLIPAHSTIGADLKYPLKQRIDRFEIHANDSAASTSFADKIEH